MSIGHLHFSYIVFFNLTAIIIYPISLSLILRHLANVYYLHVIRRSHYCYCHCFMSLYLLSFYYSTYCVPCQPLLCYLVLLILRIAIAPFLMQSRLCICVITLRTILPSLKITSYIISTSPFYTHIITYVMGLRNMQFAQTFANIFVQYAY